MSRPTLFESNSRPAQVLDPWAGNKVTSWTDLNSRISDILEVHGSADLYWRGVTNAEYGLYSSLYRRLKSASKQVDESMMIAAERKILDRARREWRLDHLSALEILAHIQHYGGPTRLLDVTRNPLIAAWFAVEQQFAEDGSKKPPTDARMFCFYGGDHVSLDSDWNGREPMWFRWHKSSERREAHWGDGANRRIWIPPNYNSRISAQNAAFILDGVPFGFPGSNGFTMGPGRINDRWHIGPLRDAGSISFKLNDPTRARQTEKSTPAFTLRIDAGAVESIRERLERNFGFSVGSLYGDLYGLAAKVAPDLPA